MQCTSAPVLVCLVLKLSGYTNPEWHDRGARGEYHASWIPVKVPQAIVVPGRYAPQAWILLKQHCCGLEEEQEVWAEEHVILYYDGMTVSLLQEHFVQCPLVVLAQPSMPRLQTSRKHLAWVCAKITHTLTPSDADQLASPHMLTACTRQDCRVMLCRLLAAVWQYGLEHHGLANSAYQQEPSLVCDNARATCAAAKQFTC